ncbi:OmpA family protein [Glaciimonas sp. PCH181]|uniref:OmpA family protein n=1 Tax=Glaciimonas sp. PCH181 TaxID=2133943 RepID=UPI000D341540|nr:OmpA family protein [Glaciimonas sp. PCH181]PUA17241.1 cell envelope biogenesis protein OmpA [Glaciimonas sp. PCH181]
MRQLFALSLLTGIAFSSAPIMVLAQTTDIQANTPSSAYLQDSRGPVARSQFGLCWRSGYWDKDSAVTGCDGELLPPFMKAIAPDLVSNPLAANTDNTAVTANSCNFLTTLSSDQTFSFGKNTLTAAAKAHIDNDIVAPLNGCNKDNVITITGHTDQLGANGYNQKLSEQRAQSVANYLKSKGVVARMNINGVGSTQEVKTCSNQLPHKSLISCFSPNRRVTISVQ